MAFNFREVLLQGVREWLKSALASELGATPNARIRAPLRASDGASAAGTPTSAAPYIMVNVLKWNKPTSHKNDHYEPNGLAPDIKRVRQQDFRATVRLVGTGHETEGWLSSLEMIRDDFDEAIATLAWTGEVMDVSGPNLKGENEDRYMLDLFFEYRLVLETPETQAQNISIAINPVI